MTRANPEPDGCTCRPDDYPGYDFCRQGCDDECPVCTEQDREDEMNEQQREHAHQISDALLTLRHSRVTAGELKPGDMVYMFDHSRDETIELCQNDTGYRVVEVQSMQPINHNQVEVITDAPGSFGTFHCSPLFNGMFLIGKDDRV